MTRERRDGGGRDPRSVGLFIQTKKYARAYSHFVATPPSRSASAPPKPLSFGSASGSPPPESAWPPAPRQERAPGGRLRRRRRFPQSSPVDPPRARPRGVVRASDGAAARRRDPHPGLRGSPVAVVVPAVPAAPPGRDRCRRRATPSARAAVPATGLLPIAMVIARSRSCPPRSRSRSRSPPRSYPPRPGRTSRSVLPPSRSHPRGLGRFPPPRSRPGLPLAVSLVSASPAAPVAVPGGGPSQAVEFCVLHARAPGPDLLGRHPGTVRPRSASTTTRLSSIFLPSAPRRAAFMSSSRANSAKAYPRGLPVSESRTIFTDRTSP